MTARVRPFDCTGGSLRNSYRAVSLRICPRRAGKYVLVHPRCAPQLHIRIQRFGIEMLRSFRRFWNVLQVLGRVQGGLSTGRFMRI